MIICGLLLEWNQKMNLTAIEEPEEIITKHFVDSLTIQKYLKKGDKVADIGTGAGFPGIPLSIMREDCHFLLIDSLNKRITFLNEVIEKLNLRNVQAIHARAEEVAIKKEYRESFDIVTSRAVANMSTLLEYLLPFVKVSGNAICMKGSNVQEEVEKSKKALEVLKGKIETIESFSLPFTDYDRNIIVVKKIGNVPKNFPRKQGKPAKEPIV